MANAERTERIEQPARNFAKDAGSGNRADFGKSQDTGIALASTMRNLLVFQQRDRAALALQIPG